MDAKELGKRLFMDCWHAGKFDVLEELLDAGHIFHLAQGDLVGIPPYRELLEGYRHAFNSSFDLQHVIGEGDFAAIHYTETGTFLNDWNTAEGVLKATGRTYSTFGVELINTRQGKILEAWPGHDSLTHYALVGLCEVKVE